MIEDTSEIKDQVQLKKKLLDDQQQIKEAYLSKKESLENDLKEILTCEIIARQKIILSLKETIKQRVAEFSQTELKLENQKQQLENKQKESNIIHGKNMEKLQEEIDNLSDDLKAAKLVSSKRILYIAQYEDKNLDNLTEKELRDMTMVQI